MTLTTRVLDVLGAFTARHPRLRLAEVVAASGLPLTTAHGIVADLVGRRCHRTYSAMTAKGAPPAAPQ